MLLGQLVAGALQLDFDLLWRDARRLRLVHEPVIGDGVRAEEVDISLQRRTAGVQVSMVDGETTPYAPNSPYAASKAAADHLVRAYHHTYGLPVLTTNCSNNYGPYQFPEKLIPLVIANALDERPVPVYGEGQNVRDWLYVEDHCEAIERILLHGETGRTYTIGGAAERTNLDLVRLLLDQVDVHLGREPGHAQRLITFVKDRPGHDFRYAMDFTRHTTGFSDYQDFPNFTRGLVKRGFSDVHPGGQSLSFVLREKGFLIFGGKSLKPARDLPESVFTSADMREVSEIPLPRPDKEYKIVSRQNLGALATPASSDGKVQGTVQITQPREFWEPSRYLIIVEG